MNRLLDRAFDELKTELQRVIFLQFLYGYYWLIIIIIITFSLFPALSRPFDSNKHSGSSINGIYLETWIMLVHQTM